MRKIWTFGIGILIVAGIVAAGVFLSDSLTGEPEETPAGDAASASSEGSAPPRESEPQEAASETDDAQAAPDDRVLGSADAPVTVIEYSSLTCGHCARFHREGFVHLKREYIDTGKVRLIYRDFPLDQTALDASKLARCVLPERYFDFLQVLFSRQEQYALADDPSAALVRFGAFAGLPEKQSRACMNDEKKTDEVLAERLEGQRLYEIGATPTFVIDGRVHPGVLGADELDEILQPLLGESQ